MWKRSDIEEDDSKATATMPRLSRANKDSSGEGSTGADESKKQRTQDSKAVKTIDTSTIAVIGPSITIKGEIHGGESVLVEGRVEGTVSLNGHQFIVGEDGQVAADVHAREVEVRGQLNGDIRSTEKVLICASGKVRGNVHSPRVVLEDGCQFKGSVDMDSSNSAQSGSQGGSHSASKGAAQVASAGSTKSSVANDKAKGK
jgi:cytoskeletal protein CcmA (bactofilin family)